MRTNKEITDIARDIYSSATAALEELASVKKSKVESIVNKPIEESISVIQALIADVETVLKAQKSNGVGFPAYLARLVYDEGATGKVTISVRTKLKSSYKYRKDTTVTVDEDFVSSVGKAYVDALYDMFCIETAIDNVEELNAKIATILKENDFGYSFRFAVDINTDSTVLSISDKEVVFNANTSKAHDISNLGIFRGGDEYSDFICKEATDKLIDSLKAVQTTVQLIKSNVAIIKEVTGVSTKKRASKLIRGAYHRQAKYLDKVKAGVGYFDETVKIDGEDVDVFALVTKGQDGKLSVLLSPFNVKDLYNVDFDVISAVEAQLGK